MIRSHYCGHIGASLVGQEVTLCGWVHRRRDHGGVVFIDLRDREGLVQIVFNPEAPEIFRLAESLRSEYVVAVRGLVKERPAGTINPDLKTGKVEIQGLQLTILNVSEPL